jgi:hypothetical protein
MGNRAMVEAAPQHLRALEQANEVRLARADLKRRIGAQQIDVVEVIMECPREAQSMSISDLLMSQRRWGRARCKRLLVGLNIPENKPIGTFTDRQRFALVAMLSAKAGTARPEGGAQASFDHEHRLEVVGPRSRGRTPVMAG